MASPEKDLAVKKAEAYLIEECYELLYQMEHSEGRLTRTTNSCLQRVLDSTSKLQRVLAK